MLAVYAGYALKGEHVSPGKDLEPVRGTGILPSYIEIGNEDNFDKSGSCDARFAQFALTLRKVYPRMQLIATTPVHESNQGAQADLLDDHCYKQPAEMLDFVHHYDKAPRSEPKIFVGEWALLAGSRRRTSVPRWPTPPG